MTAVVDDVRADVLRNSGVTLEEAVGVLLTIALGRVEDLVWVSEDLAGVIATAAVDLDDDGLLEVPALLWVRVEVTTEVVATEFLNKGNALDVSTDAISETDESSAA